MWEAGFSVTRFELLVGPDSMVIGIKGVCRALPRQPPGGPRLGFQRLDQPLLPIHSMSCLSRISPKSGLALDQYEMTDVTEAGQI